MGKFQIIKALDIENQIDKDKYLSINDIQKALKNMGFIYRRDYINKEVINIRNEGMLDIDKPKSIRKKYRINKEKCKYLS